MTTSSAGIGNDLEEAMHAVRHDPNLTDDFLDLLASHDIYLAQDRDPRELGVDEVLLPVTRRGERKGVPAFTSTARLQEQGSERWIAIRGCDLSGLWEPGTFLFLNPGSDVEMEIPSDDVLSLGGRREATRESMPVDARIRVGEPAEEPRALLEAVARFARGHPEVICAYRALIDPYESNIGAFPAIGLKLEAGADEQETLRLLAAAITPVSRGRVAFVSVHEATEDPIAGYMLEESRPFYARERRGGAVTPVLVVVPDEKPAANPH